MTASLWAQAVIAEWYAARDEGQATDEDIECVEYVLKAKVRALT